VHVVETSTPQPYDGLTVALHWLMPVQVLSVTPLECRHVRPLATNPRSVNLRSQVAVVRALADQVEQLSLAADADGLGTQMVEEMARLGCRLLETAAALAETAPGEGSGVFRRAGMLASARTEVES
jgi:hypothetical protein